MSKSTQVTSPLQFTTKDIEIEKKTVAYDGYFKMLKYRFRHRLFSGGWSNIVERELFERGHAVAVLLFDPRHDEVILVEQIRVGAMAANYSPWQLEIVAGIIDEGEKLEQVALRESEEEAGIKVKKLLPMMNYLSSSGGCSETISLFLGIVESKDAKGIHGLAEENEDILVHVVSFEQALKWVQSNKIENAATIIAIQWLALNKDTWLTQSES